VKGPLLTVVGARPQFIKASPVSLALARAGIREVLVHTGQHYDSAMSDVFFERLAIPAPAHHLAVGSGGHGDQTGRMLQALEPVMAREEPAGVLVYGDTNSTLAGALCAAKLHIPVFHVEAGLRSFNRRMPEEINRVLTDHLSRLLFAPTDAALANLRAEGIAEGVVRTGDVMYDAAVVFREAVGELATEVPARFGVEAGAFAVATVHRAENTDDAERWRGITAGLLAIVASGLPVVWPVHPRVRAKTEGLVRAGLVLTPPLPYFETQALLMHARVVLTDSGGLQKEAAFHRVPCVTLREETEWVELVEHGVNRLVPAEPGAIVSGALEARWPASSLPAGLYGDGRSSEVIAESVRGVLSGGAAR
jgi:UDP-GlcNAc3NAcA epimerase